VGYKTVERQVNVSAVVCTRNRYDSTLPLSLAAIATQTYKPIEVIVYDDSEVKIDLRKSHVYVSLFSMMDRFGIKWKVEFGNGAGQVCLHRRCIGEVKGDYIWRVDDDNIPESGVLAMLVGCMDGTVGAVGGLVCDPQHTATSTVASSRIEDIYLGLNRQWFDTSDTVPFEVDHLYSTFLYRKEAMKPDYYAVLSRVGHREETIATYLMKRAGWRLLVNPAAVTWHLKQPTGGIRDGDYELFRKDEEVFAGKLKEWGIKPRSWKVIALDNGIGDHYVFKKLLPDIRRRYPDLILAVCFTDVFIPTDIPLISIAEARNMTNIDEMNVYRYMADHKWTGSLEDAYRSMYGIDK
jgi:glycosyltransferase involved in cell wall biosynthesis